MNRKKRTLFGHLYSRHLGGVRLVLCEILANKRGEDARVLELLGDLFVAAEFLHV